jgi:hypothetical protein
MNNIHDLLCFMECGVDIFVGRTECCLQSVIYLIIIWCKRFFFFFSKIFSVNSGYFFCNPESVINITLHE